MATATIVVSSTVITAPSITTTERRLRAGSNPPYGVSVMPYTVSQRRYGVRLHFDAMPNRAPAELDWNASAADSGRGLTRDAIVAAAVAIADARACAPSIRRWRASSGSGR